MPFSHDDVTVGRRALLQRASIALAGALGVKQGMAQAEAEARTGVRARKPTGKFPLDVYSRSLQWLRTPQELGKAVLDIGLQSVDLTVMPFPGHVNPAKVKTELPPFVNGLKSQGVTVSAITCPITDADSPNAEAIVAAAASLGIRHYSWSGFQYDETRPYPAQLEALKARVARLAKMNEKYGIQALYQPRPGASNVGAAFFDFLEVLRNFDPRFVAFRYDTAALLQALPQTMAMHLRLGGPYIAALAVNDAAVALELPVWREGAYTAAAQQLVGASSGGDNVGRDGGNPLAIGGGGRPLPYHYKPMPVGMGMVDLTLLGKTLKEINFSGPAECQTEWPLGGAESGNDKISLPRQTVLGQIKHSRLTVEAAFANAWDLDVARPAFLEPGAPAPAGRGGRGN